jgi:hypothetical protein
MPGPVPLKLPGVAGAGTVRGMRHIGSLVGGIIAAPVIWVLLALSQSKSGALVGEWTESGLFDTSDLVEPAIYLVIVGIVVGLLATLRISPFGPFLVAVLFLALYALLFVNPVRLVDWLPADRAIAGRDLDLTTPLANGTLLVVALALLVSVFAIGRWRSRAVVADTTGTTVAEDPFAVAERDAHEERLSAARHRAEAEAEAEPEERVLRPDEDEVVVPAARTADDDEVVETDADGRPVRKD